MPMTMTMRLIGLTLLIIALPGCTNHSRDQIQDDRGCWYETHDSTMYDWRFPITDKDGKIICTEIVQPKTGK